MTESPVVLLFDIDGTLIESGGAGGGALLDALIAEFSLETGEQVPLHGRTDLGIMSELLEKHGVEASAANLDRLCEHYFSLLPQELERRGGRCLPGVRELLVELEPIEHCHLAILTGNMPTSAELKLRHYGLWKHFAFGIYGDLAADRPQLAKPAWEIIEEQLVTTTQDAEVIILGDTPLDIELAKRMNARSLAVCTGGFGPSELAEAGASLVVEDLKATSEIRNWLLNTIGTP